MRGSVCQQSTGLSGRWVTVLTLLILLAPAVSRANVWVLVDLSSQKAYVYEDDEIVVSSPISSGREGRSTRPGTFRVYQKSKDHKSYYGSYISRSDGSVVVEDADSRKGRRPSGTYFRPAPMTYFLRFNGPVGFHAGEIPGYPASHGCVRLPLNKAEVFFNYCRIGTRVVIQR